MVEGRRNSVDIPLSKTLVALKRVRSLRDPDTNSMSKFAMAANNINWDEIPCKGAYLDMIKSDKHSVTKFRNHHLNRGLQEPESNSDSDYASHEKPSLIRSRGPAPKRVGLVHEVRRHRSKKPLEPTWVPNSMNLLEEEVNSYSVSNFEPSEKVSRTAVKKRGYCDRRKPSAGVEEAIMSRVGSPCMSMSEPPTNCSSRSTIGLGAEEVDVVESNHSGCGFSYCWSRSPKDLDPNLSSGVEGEEHPLLSAEGREAAGREIVPYPETPRNLSQKYRPRTFSELIGLNVVGKSLLYAISKGKIAPMYLFHGPRGTGKTSAARIFAAALNCLSFEENRPCGFCRECIFLFSGRSRDVKELNAAKINRKDRVKALLKSASLAPFSSHFKVFIIDECQLLTGETWAAIINSVEDLCRHSVFVMITTDPDKLPHSFVSQCQRYHFPKINDADISCRLQKICTEEGLEFDKNALDFISAKANGSLRDAETILDQLSLLGKRVTLSLAYELIGVVSDEELLDLLDLALSADTKNTVKRARELMKSRVDPMQLISQLANLIMDILSGRCQSDVSDIGRNFLGRYTLSEVGMQKLRHALKVLSETEKQLRASKNQATWLTVALLQFSSGDDGVLSLTSPRESLKNSVCYEHNHNRNCSDSHCSRTKLGTIWIRAIRKCQSNSFASFLQKEGNLSSVYVNEGMAIAEIEFCHPDHASRAEKSWKLIASSLQHVLGCNVEIRIKLVPDYIRKNTKMKKPSFSLLSCSGRKRQMSESSMTDEKKSETSVQREIHVATYSSHPGQQLTSPYDQQLDAKPMQETNCFHDKAVIIRNIEEETRSIKTASDNCLQNDLTKEYRLSDSSKEVGEEGQYVAIQEHDSQPSCLAKTLKLPRRFLSSDAAQALCLRTQPRNQQEVSIPKRVASEAYFSTYDPSSSCSRSNAEVTYTSEEENIRSKDSRFSSKLLCWRASRCSPRMVL